MGSQLDNHWPKFYSAFMCACGGPSSYLGDALSNSWYQPAVRNLYWLEARRGFLITLTLPFSIWLLFLLGPFSLYDPVLKSEINRLGINIPITVRRHWNVNIWKIFITEEVSDPDKNSISWLLIIFIIIPFCRHGSKILRTCPSSQSS